jgi:hypothetical protein
MKTSNKNTIARKAMKAAWTNWKAGRYTSWSECLKSAWIWAKKVIKKTVTIFADDMYKFTEKAVCVDGKWFPLSQITQNWEKVGDTNISTLVSIEVPTWLANKR